MNDDIVQKLKTHLDQDTRIYIYVQLPLIESRLSLIQFMVPLPPLGCRQLGYRAL